MYSNVPSERHRFNHRWDELLDAHTSPCGKSHRLPVEVWFHTNPAASDTNFEAALLNFIFRE
ncbi:hypothetical protein, partial [Nostoc sp.]|uniref:hypothetical protein n=1 Tax=Nostoc sp. TaxID=1180 RepID=UPI002FFB50B5